MAKENDESDPQNGAISGDVYAFLSADDELGQNTAGSIWRGFKSKTTAHGIPHYTQAKGNLFIHVNLHSCGTHAANTIFRYTSAYRYKLG